MPKIVRESPSWDIMRHSLDDELFVQDTIYTLMVFIGRDISRHPDFSIRNPPNEMTLRLQLEEVKWDWQVRAELEWK